MTQTTISSREFNQRVTDAKRASLCGPVFITDRGEPSHVLLSIEEYKKISGKQESITDLLAMPFDDDIEFDIPKSKKEFFKPTEF